MRDIEYAIHYNFCADATYSTLAAHLSPTGEEQCMLMVVFFPLSLNSFRLPLNPMCFLSSPQMPRDECCCFCVLSFLPFSCPRIPLSRLLLSKGTTEKRIRTGDVTFPLPIWYDRRRKEWGAFSRTATWLKPPLSLAGPTVPFLSSSEARLQQRCLNSSHKSL